MQVRQRYDKRVKFGRDRKGYHQALNSYRRACSHERLSGDSNNGNEIPLFDLSNKQSDKLQRNTIARRAFVNRQHGSHYWDTYRTGKGQCNNQRDQFRRDRYRYARHHNRI